MLRPRLILSTTGSDEPVKRNGGEHGRRTDAGLPHVAGPRGARVSVTVH
jgi:hypothetical protein